MGEKNNAWDLNAPAQISSHPETLSFFILNLSCFPPHDKSSSVSKASRPFPRRELWLQKHSKAATHSELLLRAQSSQQIPLPSACLLFLSLLIFRSHAHGQSHSLLWPFTLASCFSHPFSSFHAAVRFSFLFTEILFRKKSFYLFERERGREEKRGRERD